MQLNLTNKPTEFYLDSQALINAVRDHPLLYDNTRSDFNNRKKKREAWLEIFATVMPNWRTLTSAEREFCENELQKKWRNMRDSYTKEFKRRANISSSLKASKPYIYFEAMSFLLPMTEKRHPMNEPVFQNTSSSVEMYLEVDDMDSQASPSRSSPINPNDFCDESQSNSESRHSVNNKPSIQLNIGECNSPIFRSQSHKRKSKKFKTGSVEKFQLQDYLGKFLKHIDKELSTNTEPTKNDPDEMFLLSMLPFWKKMNDSTKLTTQIDILKLIQTRLNEQI